jgi:hypothetical protein
VNGWELACLATIAVATVVMAIVQVTVAVQARRLARQAADAAQQLRRELGPLLEKVNRISDDAARVTALAVVQVERVDRMLNTTAARVDEVTRAVQAIVEPLRQGSTWMGAIGLVTSIIRDWRQRRRSDRDDEDALFVG